jgi:hypothetical protein
MDLHGAAAQAGRQAGAKRTPVAALPDADVTLKNFAGSHLALFAC